MRAVAGATAALCALIGAVWAMCSATRDSFTPSDAMPRPFAARLVALASRARPPRPALAGHARPVPRLAVGDHAAADAGRDGDALLPALPRPLSRRRRAGRGAARRRDGAVERARLLRAARATCTRCAQAVVERARRRVSARCRGHRARCPASAARPPRRSLSSASASAPRSSTATSSACSRACSASTGFAGSAEVEATLWRRAEALLPGARHRGATPRA